MWLEVTWARQDLPGGSARCLVPLSTGREPGTPLLQPPASAPLDNPDCFPSKVCVPQCCLCLLSSLPSFPFLLSLLSSLPAFCLTQVALIRVVHKAQVPTPLLLDLSLHPGGSGVPSHVGHAGIGESLGSPPSCPPLPPPSLWDERQGQVPRRCSASQTEGTGAQGRSRGGSQKSRWGLRNAHGETQGAGRGAWRALGSLRDSEFPEVLEGPGRALGCKGRQKENLRGQ